MRAPEGAWCLVPHRFSRSPFSYARFWVGWPDLGRSQPPELDSRAVRLSLDSSAVEFGNRRASSGTGGLVTNPKICGTRSTGGCAPARRSVAIRYSNGIFQWVHLDLVVGVRGEVGALEWIDDERFVPANGVNPEWATYYTVQLHDNSMPPRAGCHSRMCSRAGYRVHPQERAGLPKWPKVSDEFRLPVQCGLLWSRSSKPRPHLVQCHYCKLEARSQRCQLAEAIELTRRSAKTSAGVRFGLSMISASLGNEGGWFTLFVCHMNYSNTPWI